MEEYENVVKLLQKDGCSLKYPVTIADVDKLTVDGEQAIMPIACEHQVTQISSLNR